MIPTANLLARLDGRVRNLFGASSAGLPSQLANFVGWLENEPFLASLLKTLPDPGVGGEEWITENIRWGKGIDFPPGEDAMVGCCWLVTRHVAAADDVGMATLSITHQFDHDVRDQDDADRAFLKTFVAPLVAWLSERVVTHDHVLHSLERYAREAAWFRRDELREKYEADTGTGEKTLDLDLRRHLFRDGIDFPFPQVRGPIRDSDALLTAYFANGLFLSPRVAPRGAPC